MATVGEAREVAAGAALVAVAAGVSLVAGAGAGAGDKTTAAGMLEPDNALVLGMAPTGELPGATLVCALAASKLDSPASRMMVAIFFMARFG